VITNAECRHHIELVRSATNRPEAAYAARTRLKRLILACSRMIAQEYGAEEPVLPGPFKAPPAAPQDAQRIANCCSRLADMAKTLCQPSEPLDIRWRAGWTRVQGELTSLEDALGGG
jgi:hypothetical protein